MKKFTLIIILILSCFSLLKANGIDSTKNKNSKGFHFGLKAAPSISWMKPNSDNLTYGGTKLNVNGGLILDFNFTNNYAFSTGFEITSFGGKLDYPSSNTDSVFYTPEEETVPLCLSTRTLRLRYINVPLTLKLKTNQIGAMVYYGQFGFDMGLRWRARADDDGFQKKISTTKKDIDIQEDISFMRLSLNVGLGVEYNLAGNTSLVVGANYNNGFTNALRKDSKMLKDKTGGRLEQEAFANYVALSVGVLF